VAPRLQNDCSVCDTIAARSGGGRFAVKPDGRRIATGSADATVKVWDAHSGKELLTLNAAFSVNSVAFSPDGRRIVTGSTDATAKVWDVQSGEELLTLKGHSSSVMSVAFSPDGRRIVTGSTDATAKVWDFANTISPSASPNDTGAQKLTRVYVKKYGVSALLPTNVFPDAKNLSNSDQAFLQGNSWTGQTTLTFSSVREPLAKVYAECATEHSPQAPSKTVHYKVLKPTWFVVSGDLGPEADASLGFYTKGVKKGSFVVIMHFQWREDDFPFSEETFTAMSRGFDGN
jgi:WD domain, G-beta repeat